MVDALQPVTVVVQEVFDLILDVSSSCPQCIGGRRMYRISMDLIGNLNDHLF